MFVGQSLFSAWIKKPMEKYEGKCRGNQGGAYLRVGLQKNIIIMLYNC